VSLDSTRNRFHTEFARVDRRVGGEVGLLADEKAETLTI
jgi:hypothetical protein